MCLHLGQRFLDGEQGVPTWAEMPARPVGLCAAIGSALRHQLKREKRLESLSIIAGDALAAGSAPSSKRISDKSRDSRREAGLTKPLS